MLDADSQAGVWSPQEFHEFAPTAQNLLRREERKWTNAMSCKHFVFGLLLLLDWLTISKGDFAVFSDFILLKRGKKAPSLIQVHSQPICSQTATL